MKTFVKLLLFILIFCSFDTIAQDPRAKDHFNTAKRFYDQDKYYLAIDELKKALQYDDIYQDALFYLGGSFLNNKQYIDALAAFEKLEKIDSNYWAWYYYWKGNALENLDRFKEAMTAYKKFDEKYPKEGKFELYHHQSKYKYYYCKKSPEIRASPKIMDEPINMGDKINSKWGDYFPQSNPTGKIIYFTSQRQGGMGISNGSDENGWGEDIYFIEKTDSGWSAPEGLPAPINTKGHDAAATFSGDGQMMVYYASYRKDAIGGGDLYYSILDGKQWSEPKNLGNVVNSKEWDSQPTISADGSILIFSSDKAGSYGEYDLYMTTKNKFGDFGVPVNLGEVVNTPFSEVSPFLCADGKTLYFASTGHPGYGGFDLFKTVFENGKWSEPKNLGAPLNSPDDDKYFTIGGSGETGFFASNRKCGFGDLDLYTINIPDKMRPSPTVIVSGVVSNSKDKKPLGSWVLIEDIETGELISTNKSNSETGKYLVVLPAGRNYSVSANKEGFFFYSYKFDVPKVTSYKEITMNIELQPIEKGATIILNNIFFETAKAALSHESIVELKKAVNLMKTNSTMIVEVGGHTDNVGNPESNIKLSLERAKSVRDFLIKSGIESNRIQAKGYGQTTPVADNATNDGRQANRRTEFKIIDF